MRVFFRSAPALMALSVALAGCNQYEPPESKSSTGGSSPAGVSASTAPTTADPSEYVLTVQGMV